MGGEKRLKANKDPSEDASVARAGSPSRLWFCAVRLEEPDAFPLVLPLPLIAADTQG